MKQSKKFPDKRSLPKHTVISAVGNSMLEIMQRLNGDNPAANLEFLSPKPRLDGRYVTSEGTLNRWIDPKIFMETQLKRFMRWLTTIPILKSFFIWLLLHKLKMKLDYFY